MAVILLFLLSIIFTLPNKTYASFFSAREIIDGAKDFVETGEDDADERIDSSNLEDMSNSVYTILLIVGIAVAVIIGLIMGIKFALGSLEEKAEMKTMLISYIVGCVVVFGAFAIWKIVVDVLQSI